MKNLFVSLILAAVLLSGCGKENPTTWECSFSVVYENGDTEILKTDFTCRGEPRHYINVYKNASPCIVIAQKGSFGIYKAVTCGVRRYSLIEIKEKY